MYIIKYWSHSLVHSSPHRYICQGLFLSSLPINLSPVSLVGLLLQWGPAAGTRQRLKKQLLMSLKTRCQTFSLLCIKKVGPIVDLWTIWENLQPLCPLLLLLLLMIVYSIWQLTYMNITRKQKPHRVTVEKAILYTICAHTKIELFQRVCRNIT